MSPTLYTTVVGSYPAPQWFLHSPPSPMTFRDAVLVVLQTQERAGIDVVSDGELTRFDPAHPETNGMIDYFVGQMSGISRTVSRAERERFAGRSDMAFRRRPAGVVRGKIGEGSLDLPRDWLAVQDLATRPLKFTVTSPFMLAQTLLDGFYHDLETLTMDLAEVLRKQITGIDAQVIQVDEANLPGQPEQGPLAAQAINHVLAAAQNGKGVHLCFGNYGGQTVQKGWWKNLLPFFNSLQCDHLLLEFARRGFNELEVFRELKAEISLGVGVIDIKDNEVESPETVARRIERAVTVLGPERIRWVHPDCGFWMLPRSIADAKMASLVRGRDLFLGRGGHRG